MKRILLSIALLLALTGLQAQKRKYVQKLPNMTVEEALSKYDFANAELLLNNEIATLKRKRQPTVEQEERLQWIHKAQIKLNAVERVAFIDSVIVPRNKAVNQIHLSSECGAIYRYADFFHKVDSMDCMVFQSQMGDQLFYAHPDASNSLSLYMRDMYSDGSTSQPILLEGISDDENHQNYPFMMADGTTMYFAAQGPESLGGYDIFMTRYDADEHRFLTPENIGMPFNSPGNDYLYVVDESNNIGWFVTDRNMTGDSVCIYTFIPNETRKVYIPEEVGDSALRELARITRIQDTWSDENAIRSAQFRLRDSKKVRQETLGGDFDFVVTDNIVYHKREDFKVPQAAQTLDLWLRNKTELEKTYKTLELLRKSYHTANQQQRTKLRSEILMLEQNEEELLKQLKQQERMIRKLELGL